MKPQTLYAYVSRGRIASRPDPSDSRRSLYAAGDIARLAGEPDAHGLAVAGPGLRAPARGEVDIRSSLSTIRDGRLFYRGLDAVQLSASATLEDVARRLWDAAEANPFAGLTPRIDAVLGSSPRNRFMAALARRAYEDVADPGRGAAELGREAASVLDEVIDAVAGGGPRLFLHQRLGRAWKAGAAEAATQRHAAPHRCRARRGVSDASALTDMTSPRNCRA